MTLKTPKTNIHQDLLRQQTTLARFGELALRSNNLDQILTEACRLAGEALGTDLAKVVQLQDDGETLLVRAGVGWKSGVVGTTTIKVTEHTSEGHALRTGEPMISPDIAKETRFTYPAFLIENGVRAVANVLIIGGKDRPPFGILQVDSRQPRKFTDSDTAFLRSYANLLAATVERLNVIEEMKSGEARLRLALETGELGSWELDLPSGKMSHSIRFDQIFGFDKPPPTWNYETFLSHILPEDREQVIAMLQDAAATGKEWYFQCRIRMISNGVVRWVEARGKSGGLQNFHQTRLLGIIADVTERKRAEEALLRSNELLEGKVAERTLELTVANTRLKSEAEERERVEDALRQSHKMEAVGQLTGGLAHDFNNLLAGISGALELMQTRIAQGRTSEIGRYIEPAMMSVARAATITQRLLAFSRRQTLAPKPTDATKLIGGLQELFVRTVGPGIRVDTIMIEGLWPTLCDPNQLESALLNLVINARDAMPDGGNLSIEATNSVFPPGGEEPRDVLVKNVPAGEYVALRITDTGIGMTPDQSARAFDPFFTTKPIGQGTGLGLSMVYGFVEQSGGHVSLRSEVGKGTAVTIYLPRLLAGHEADFELTAVTSPQPAAASKVILVVDDEPAVRMTILEALSDHSYRVLEAENGQSGLSILKTQTGIDLLVTDVGLPGGMNGRQLADAARQNRPGLKVMFITGYAESKIIERERMDLGMDVMIKPFKLSELLNRVGKLINS